MAFASWYTTHTIAPYDSASVHACAENIYLWKSKRHKRRTLAPAVCIERLKILRASRCTLQKWKNHRSRATCYTKSKKERKNPSRWEKCGGFLRCFLRELNIVILDWWRAFPDACPLSLVSDKARARRRVLSDFIFFNLLAKVRSAS